MSATYDTIVIGLGAAGTTAVSTLAKAGKKVLALEAENRIGGRVKTVQLGDGVAEEGAEWIDGTLNSCVMDVAASQNVPVLPDDPVNIVYNSDGTPGNTDLIEELMNYCTSIAKTPSKEPGALGDYLTKKIPEYLKEKHPHLANDKEFLSEIYDLLHVLISYDKTSYDWNDISLQTEYVSLGGHLFTSWHKYGFKTFFDILLNTYNNGPGFKNVDIKLSKEVTQIKWPKNSTGNVEVVCKDGEVFTANNVIVTVSLGVLKERYTTLFSPPIPEQKATAIQKISFGLIGKIILSFPEQWMREKGYVFFYLPGDKNNTDSWVTKIRAASAPKGSGNTITLWTSGHVTELVEKLPEDVVKTKVVEHLRRFLGKDMVIPDATGIIVSKWHSNPFTRGALSFTGLSVHEYPNARKHLAEPLTDIKGNPKVLFAGEATELSHFGTVHGASETGHREAKRLLN